MADVKMCDRCGAINYPETFGLKVQCANGQERFLETIGNNYYDFDLCPKCISDLADWFAKGVNANGTK